MIKLVDRYIARQVIVTSLVVLILLVSLRSLFSLLDELGDLDKGSYQLADALLYVGLLIPSRLIEFFPMSVLIGALFGLGSMASNSELTVLRAAGMTTWQIAGSAVKASLILALLVIAISEWIAPASNKSAQQLRTSAISGGGLSFSKTGLWAKRQNEMIQIGSILNDGKLKDISLYQISNIQTIESIIKADSAVYSGENWLLQNVVETQFDEEKVNIIKQNSRIWVNPLAQSQIETLALEPDSLNIIGLLNYLEYLSENQLDAKNFKLAFWRKILLPLSIAIMMFLAASFVFGPMRDVSMGARILSGVMLGFVFHLAVQSFGPISLVYNFWPFVGAIMPLVLFSSLALWLMKKSG